jgi:hypothetical protein
LDFREEFTVLTPAHTGGCQPTSLVFAVFVLAQSKMLRPFSFKNFLVTLGVLRKEFVVMGGEPTVISRDVAIPDLFAFKAFPFAGQQVVANELGKGGFIRNGSRRLLNSPNHQ